MSTIILAGECLMKTAIRFLFWAAFLLLLLVACATADFALDKRKALSEDNRRVGDAYIRQGDYTRGLGYYQEAAKHYADDPELQYRMGQAYQEKRNYTRAIEHFNRALALKPDMTKAKTSAGATYIKMKDYDQAILILKQAIDGLAFEIYTKPQYPKYLLGWAFYLNKQYPESERSLQETLDYYTSGIPKDPIYVQALRIMGLNALAQSQPEKAISFFEKTIPFAPKWPDLYLDIARAHRLAGETPRARQAYNRVIELAPGTDIAETAKKESASLN
jgi:type IV pilus assembly protein PilF